MNAKAEGCGAHQFKIGDRVAYRAVRVFGTAGGGSVNHVRECAGTVVAIYEGYRYTGTDDDDDPSHDVPTRYAVQVDAPLPAWWSRPQTDRFCPDTEALTLLSSSNPSSTQE